MSSTHQQNSKQKIWAIIPAAGSGSRMGAEKPKQYLQVAGKTVLEHTVDALLAFEPVDAIQLCLAANDDTWASLDVESSRLLPPTIGGATRADSVLAGLQALKLEGAEDDDWVMVHDAARPCVDQASLQRLVDEVIVGNVGGILAVPVADTIKQVSDSSSGKRIEKTIDRSVLWAAQTPQMFRYGLLKQCLLDCVDKNLLVTDEASALEQMGYQPIIVEGSSSNLKITYPADLGLAERYLLSK